jgi:hypothetical protein
MSALKHGFSDWSSDPEIICTAFNTFSIFSIQLIPSVGMEFVIMRTLLILMIVIALNHAGAVVTQLGAADTAQAGITVTDAKLTGAKALETKRFLCAEKEVGTYCVDGANPVNTTVIYQ